MQVLDLFDRFEQDHVAAILPDRISRCVISVTNPGGFVPLTATFCCVITEKYSNDSAGNIYPAGAFGSRTNR